MEWELEEKAKESSKQALKMLENLLMSGFDKETSLELINTSLINKNDENLCNTRYCDSWFISKEQ